MGAQDATKTGTPRCAVIVRYRGVEYDASHFNVYALAEILLPTGESIPIEDIKVRSMSGHWVSFRAAMALGIVFVDNYHTRFYAQA